MREEGNNVIFADQKRIQLLRHRVGQLDSVKAVPYEELEMMRTETAIRLKELEEVYWGKKDAKEFGPRLREKYNKKESSTIDADYAPGENKAATTPGILKKGKVDSLAQPKMRRGEEEEFVPKFDYKNLPKDDGPSLKKRKQSRSKSAKNRSPSPEAAPQSYTDPR